MQCDTFQATIPTIQQMLTAGRLTVIVARQNNTKGPTFQFRIILCQPTMSDTVPSPIVTLVHDGGHYIGYLYLELNLTGRYDGTTLHIASLYSTILPPCAKVFFPN
jgi:hypothetical protein